MVDSLQNDDDDLETIEAQLDEEIGYAPSDEEPAYGYAADPDDDPTRRDEVAAEDASALTRSAVLVSFAAVLFAGLLSLVGVPGMQSFAKGLAVGTATATLNLRVLANASWWIFNGRLVASLLGFAASFISLIGVAVWVIKVHPEWTLGYGVGLGLPAVAGVVYAATQAKAAKDEKGL